MKEELQWKAIEEKNCAMWWGDGWIQWIHPRVIGLWCKGNLTDLRRILHLSLAKGNPKRTL
jgi:hypothetical protein